MVPNYRGREAARLRLPLDWWSCARLLQEREEDIRRTGVAADPRWNSALTRIGVARARLPLG